MTLRTRVVFVRTFSASASLNTTPCLRFRNTSACTATMKSPFKLTRPPSLALGACAGLLT